MNKFASLFTLAPIGALLMVSCGGGGQGDHHEEGEEEHHHGEDEIVMSPADAARFGVLVEEIKPDDFVETVKVLGEVMASSTDQTIATAPTSGIVKLAKCTETGEKVTAGHLIATISSTGVSGGDRNRADKAALEAAKRELDRLTPLLKEGIVTKKDYNEALAAYETAKSQYSPSAASGRVTATGSGVITGLMVSDGAFVEAGQPIATISNNTRLTLKALLPAKDINFLPMIENANIVTDRNRTAIDLSTRGGKLLSSAASSAVEGTGYIPVYFSFDNAGDLLTGTPVEVFLIGKEKTQTMSVPLSSIAEQQGEKFVYVKIEDHAYSKQNVTTGRSDGKRIEILSGLNEGDSVVVAGTTFVRLAETSTVVPEGHSHHH